MWAGNAREWHGCAESPLSRVDRRGHHVQALPHQPQLQQGLHVATTIGDAVDENVASGDLANHAIWLEMHFAKVHDTGQKPLQALMQDLARVVPCTIFSTETSRTNGKESAHGPFRHVQVKQTRGQWVAVSLPGQSHFRYVLRH